MLPGTRSSPDSHSKECFSSRNEYVIPITFFKRVDLMLDADEFRCTKNFLSKFRNLYAIPRIFGAAPLDGFIILAPRRA